jgi:hypothetical protein
MDAPISHVLCGEQALVKVRKLMHNRCDLLHLCCSIRIVFY